MSGHFITTACVLCTRRYPAHPASVPILAARDTTCHICGNETMTERYDTTLHIAPMLTVPMSKITHFKRKNHSGSSSSLRISGVCQNIQGNSCTRSISGLFTAEYCTSTRSISGLCTAEYCESILLWILPVLKVFQGSVLRVLHVRADFRPSVLRVHGVR